MQDKLMQKPTTAFCKFNTKQSLTSIKQQFYSSTTQQYLNKSNWYVKFNFHTLCLCTVHITINISTNMYKVNCHRMLTKKTSVWQWWVSWVSNLKPHNFGLPCNLKLASKLHNQCIQVILLLLEIWDIGMERGRMDTLNF